MTGKAGALSSSIYLETHSRRVRCKCLNGHIFISEIYSIINTKTDGQALAEIISGSNQSPLCTICGADCPVAEPITFHDPQNERLALFIPDVLSHRELFFKADLLYQLADTETNVVPSYFEDFQTLVGTHALLTWHNSAQAEDKMISGPLSIDLVNEKQPDDRQTSPIDLLDEKPPIHEAFADLARSDSQFPSIIPEDDSLDDWSEEVEPGAQSALNSSSPQYHLAGVSGLRADGQATPITDFEEDLENNDLDFVDLLTAEEKLSTKVAIDPTAEEIDEQTPQSDAPDENSPSEEKETPEPDDESSDESPEE